jgi:hypothetical protein
LQKSDLQKSVHYFPAHYIVSRTYKASGIRIFLAGYSFVLLGGRPVIFHGLSRNIDSETFASFVADLLLLLANRIVNARRPTDLRETDKPLASPAVDVIAKRSREQAGT